MAVVSVDERARRRPAGDSLTERTRTRVFLVETDDIITAPDDVLKAAAVPKLGDVHPDEGTTFAVERAVLETDNRLIFELEVRYSTDATGEGFKDNPLEEDDQIIWRGVEIPIVLVKDINGKAIENSATDAFDPPLEEPDYEPELTIVRNELTFDPDQATTFRGRVNLDVIQLGGATAQVGQARMAQFDGQSQKRNGIEFFTVTYVIRFRTDRLKDVNENPLFWKRDVLDQGLNELVGGLGGEKQHIRLLGELAKTPQKLNGFARPLDPGDDGIYITFETVQSIAFGPLNLPENARP